MPRPYHTRYWRGSSIAEFGPMLVVLLICMLFPLINLFSVACGIATVHLLANNAARQSGSASSQTEALQCMSDQAKLIIQSGIGKFAHLRPVNGYQNLGVDLYIDRTQVSSTAGKITPVASAHFGPNQPYPSEEKLDKDAYVYTYCVQARMEVLPLFNFSKAPFGLSKIPAVGQPITVVHTVACNVEHPEGLISRQR